MAFDSDIKHWLTLESFVAYLQTISKPSWVKGICNHNTYRPNETQWRGMASMLSMRQTYINKGWSAGPHLYLVAACPNPADRGIWQLTPLAHQGVHAGACNATMLGVESVGDFDAHPPSAAQYQLLLAVNRAILQRWMLSPEHVNVHRDCMPGRTCPGKYLTGTQIRADLNTPIRYRAKVCAPIFQDRKPDAIIAGSANQGVIEAVDDLTNGWLHLASGLGFTPLGCWEPL